MGPISSFVLSMIAGHLFSKGADFTGDQIKNYFNEKSFPEILDEFDKHFIDEHDSEITQSNCDIQSVINNRHVLLVLAERYLKQDNTNIDKDSKGLFIDDGCTEIGESSKVVKVYLDGFFDLILMKEIKEIPSEIVSLINTYANRQYHINQEFDQRLSQHDEAIGNLEDAVIEMRYAQTMPVDFSSYYQNVIKSFIEKKEDGYSELVGDESDEKSYIDAFITTGSKQVSVLPYLDEWFSQKKHGTMLICGEPGHGKSLLCKKAVVDFYRGMFLNKKAKQVIAVSLNTGENRSIIKERNVILENALVWGAENEKKFTFEDCNESLLFMDGYDEFIDDAKQSDTGMDNICFFMKRLNAISKCYGIHIVVLSRTTAVSNNLENLSNICEHHELLPLSESQQDEWLNRHYQYENYKTHFCILRNNKNMHEIIGIPLLFRLIVHNQFNIYSPNIVELYNNLFIHLMSKRNIFGIERQQVSDGLMRLAFEVYCTDANMAVPEFIKWDSRWIFAFYVKTADKGKIGFFHRSFYQFFLAKYIYQNLIYLADENAENLIGSFAEREIDDTVCKYLSLMFDKEDMSNLHANIEKLINALIRSEAYLNLTPHIKSEYTETSRILRSTNVYRNTLHIAAAFSYVIPVPFKGNLELMIKTYNSTNIKLFSNSSTKVNLYGIDLSGVNLRGADLSGANLRKANLSRANLNGARLSKADLSEAKLEGANLSSADLSGANLKEANLAWANLSIATLNGADLRKANLFYANLEGTNLGSVFKVIYDQVNSEDEGFFDMDNILEDFFNKPDLSIGEVLKTDLRGACLSGALLNYTRFSSSVLVKNPLTNCSVGSEGGNLPYIDLYRTDLHEANLNRTDLSRAILNGAIIDIKYKELIDPKLSFHKGIKWVSDEND